MSTNRLRRHTWARRLFGGVFAAVLALGATAPSVALAAGGQGIASHAPEHHKTIQANGDGTYDLTLSVTGDVEESQTSTPVDVVVVVDCSTSMNEGIGGRDGRSRMQAAHDAVSSLANKLLTEQNAALPAEQQVQMSVVTFGTHADVAQGFTADASAASSAVPTQADEGNGTNWEAGLKKANGQASGRANAEKYVVFLSDGNPTFHDTQYTEEHQGWFGSHWTEREHENQYGCYGNGTSDDGHCYDFAKAEANRRDPSVNFYAVSAARDASNMSKLASETNGTYLDGTTASNLANAFDQIAQTIKKSARYKDVKIADKLSQWVTGTAADGSIENVRYAKGGSTWDDAPTASINGGSLTWDLSSVGELEDDVTYSVTFTIRPSEAAYSDVADKGAAQTYETNDQSGTYVEYKAVAHETGKEDVVSDTKTDVYELPTIELAAPSPTTLSSGTISGTKTLSGRDLSAGEFSFAISAAADSAEDTPLPSTTTVANAADGSFSFGDITFTHAGTYLYDVAEDTSSLPAGVSAVTQGGQRVTVVVASDGKGGLTARVELPENGLAFENAYDAEDAIVSINATKAIAAPEGIEAPELNDGDFQFTMAANTEGAPLPSETTVSNRDGNVTFGDMTFTKDMLGGAMEKTFSYTITESGQKDGVTNDGSKTFDVTVIDDGQGHLAAEVSGDLAFVNTYAAAPVSYSVTQDVSVSKELTGRALAEGEFSFELVEDGNVVATGTNAADGTVSFPTITYTTPGEHNYTVREAVGNADGVTYDDGEYGITVSVTDNGAGQLIAKAKSDDDITFENTYVAAPAAVSLSATKVLEGRDLTDGEFSFVLENNGQVMDTATNAADGTVSFRELTLKTAGTYTFTVSEVQGNEEGVTYDTAKHTITVTVSDNGQGRLEVSVEGDNPTFTNAYVKPAEPADEPASSDDSGASAAPEKQMPQTGDTNNAALPVVIAAVAVVCIAAGVVVSRKKRQ